MVLQITPDIQIPDSEIVFEAIRAQGAGGQHVNKVASAVHLRFDISGSSLPEEVKTRLFTFRDQRISKEGIIVIKAQQFRSQEKNKEDALKRLKKLVLQAMARPKKRKPTRVSKSARKKRLDKKTKRGHVKRLRKPVSPDDG